ncbi:MAG: APC family permease [Thermoguttaceae bacterium]
MQAAPKRELSLFDSTCLIMGIIIGTGIFVFPPMVAARAGSWQWFLAIWIVGGVLSLFGALGYAELASAYPREGGDYVYLSRAYGPWAGFLFGWIQLVVVRPADIGVMAFGFATYARRLYDPFSSLGPDQASPALVAYAAGATVILTLVNILGVRQGKWTQNVLTSIKLIGLLAIVGVALFAPHPTPAPTAAEPLPLSLATLSLAMVFVLFTFGGWNEMAYVAAEVKNAERNIVRALVLGISAVTLVYLLVNGAYLYALGFRGVAQSQAVATDTVNAVFPGLGGGLISALVCISALGVINGQIMTGARISYAMGTDHRQFRLLGRWHEQTGTPVVALLVQGAIAVGLILVLGSLFETVMFAAPVVYTFYLATSLGAIVLRYREPSVKRPFRIPAFPLPTLAFVAVCGYLIWNQLNYRPLVGAISLGLMFWGLTVYSPRKWALSWGATIALITIWGALATPQAIPKESAWYGTILHAVYPGHIPASPATTKLIWAIEGLLAFGLCILWHRLSQVRQGRNPAAQVLGGLLFAVASIQPLLGLAYLAGSEAGLPDVFGRQFGGAGAPWLAAALFATVMLVCLALGCLLQFRGPRMVPASEQSEDAV